MRLAMIRSEGTKFDVGYRYLRISAVLLLALMLAGCSKSNVQAAGPAGFPAPLVTVAQASAQDVPRYLDEIGKNGAYESVNVTPQVSARIIKSHLQYGENLRKSQLRSVIQTHPYKPQRDS